MTPRRLIAFSVLAVMMACVGCTAAIIALDTWSHRKYDAGGGLNRWGYRGPVVGAKHAGDWRILAIGGSTVLGYGLPWQDAFPAQLETVLRRTHPSSVINLGCNSEGAYAMRATLEDYARLRPDLVILYEGYNDLAPTRVNTQICRRESVIFRLTGYYPLLPVVVQAKIMALRYGGDLTAAYKDQPTVFRPAAPQQAAIGALTAAESVSASLARQFGRLSPDGVTTAPRTDSAQVLAAYIAHISDAVRWARAHRQRVLVVGQPFISDTHVQQQNALESALTQTFGADPGVEYVRLGRQIDLDNRALAWDGVHLTPAGNARVAAVLAPRVQALLSKN